MNYTYLYIIIYITILLYSMNILSNAHAGMIEKKRFGYIDRASNYQTMYEDGESDETLFPGIHSFYIYNNILSSILI